MSEHQEPDHDEGDRRLGCIAVLAFYLVLIGALLALRC